jgi:hypothetical protein
MVGRGSGNSVENRGALPRLRGRGEQSDIGYKGLFFVYAL